MEYLPRHLAGVVDGLLDAFRVVVVTGARQVGKSTLARAVLERRPGSYLTLDRPDVLERATRDPLSIAEAHACGLTVIDEVQLAPDLLRTVKLAVDQDERPGAFLLTGSANLLRMSAVTESLAGRAAYVELGPLTLSERLCTPLPRTLDAAFASRTAEEFLAALPVGEPAAAFDLREAVCDAVVTGGMPGTLSMSAEVRRRWYDSYLSTFVERDLWQLGRVDDVPAFRRLYALAMLRTAGLVNRSDLAADAGMDHRTVTRYLDLLDVGYQLRTLTPYATSASKRLVKMPKIYARDSGMAAHISRIENWETALATGAAGRLLEGWAIGELLALDALAGTGSAASFWRTSAGSEVDLLLERGTDIVAIEVKASATVRWSDARALIGLRATFGSRFRMGIIAYLGAEVRMLGDRVCAAPIWTLLGACAESPLLAREARAAYGAATGGVLAGALAVAGLNLEEIAVAVGADPEMVAQWERDSWESAPLWAVRRIARELGLSVRVG